MRVQRVAWMVLGLLGDDFGPEPAKQGLGFRVSGLGFREVEKRDSAGFLRGTLRRAVKGAKFQNSYERATASAAPALALHCRG